MKFEENETVELKRSTSELKEAIVSIGAMLNKHGKGRPRNPLIAEALYLSEDIEKWGSGLRRISQECKAERVKVEFRKIISGFMVTFYRPEISVRGEPVDKDEEKTVEKIFAMIKTDPRITQKDIMDKTGLTRRGVEWNLKKLKDEERIRRIGPDKGGHWEIIK